jgi:hypothetical protein
MPASSDVSEHRDQATSKKVCPPGMNRFDRAAYECSSSNAGRPKIKVAAFD